MNVLVTGSSGYIGSVMCKMLSLEGHVVHGLDIALPTPAQDRYLTNFYQCDIADTQSLAHRFLAESLGEIDCIFHFAATADVGLSMVDPALFFENNIGATSKFVRYLIQKEWNGHFVFSSSAAVYGDQPITSYYFEEGPLKPINPYGLSKLMCEQMLEQISAIHNMKVTSFRYFNVAGAWDDLGDHLDTGHIIPRLCKAKYNEEQFHLYGDQYPTEDGTCVRDYVHVRDICRAHKHVVDTQQERIKAYNLGNGRGYSNRQIINAVEKVAPGRLNVEIHPARPGDPAVLVAERSKFCIETSFKYEYNLDDIVASAWQYYYNKRGNS